MADITEMRLAVKRLYSGAGWKKKVEAMSDAQVSAIFHRQGNKREEAEAQARAEKRRAARTGQTPAKDDIPF